MSLDRFKSDVMKDYNASEEGRYASNIDHRFIYVDGAMWEDFLMESHHNDTNRRARLELDVTSDYVMRFIGEWTLNRANVTFTPDDASVTDDDAELLNGIYRNDFKENGGQRSQDVAVSEAAVGGFGAFKLTEKFVDEEDPENDDVEIVWEAVHTAYNSVMFDANAKLADKSDARRVTVLTSYTHDAFEDEFGDIDMVSAFTPSTRSEFQWFTPKLVWVAERYEIVRKKETVQVWENVELNKVQAYKEEEMDDLKPELEAMGWKFVRKRDIQSQTVEKSIFTGNDFIEKPKRIAGKYLPIIPFYGYRTFVDGIEHYRGLVRKLKDSNRVLNTSISRMLEDSSTSGKTMPIFTKDQIKGLTDDWADLTNKNFGVVNNMKDANGNPILAGPVGTLPATQIDPNTVGIIDVVSNYVQRQTGNLPEDQLDPDASGKAINAARKFGNLNTQVISDNIVQSIKWSGVVYRSKAADNYTRTQMKKSIGEDGTTKMVTLNQLSLDPVSGNPININDLTHGRFSVDVEVGPQYESQKEATLESIERVIGIIGDTPEAQKYMATLLGVWMENISGTGLKPLKDLNRRLMILDGTIKPETDEEKQMVQQIQNQSDPQAELNEAIANQQNSEAAKLQSDAELNKTKAIQNMASAEKTKTEAVKNIVDIRGILQQQQDDRRADEIFRRFQERTQLPGS